MIDLRTSEAGLAGYQAARNTAALRNEADHGRLWLEGEDCVPFLQRMTTNNVRLAPGKGTVTILTSPTARILATFTVLAEADGLLLLAGPAQGPMAYNALSAQIFFNDRVTVGGRGSALAQFGLYGPRASQILAAAGASDMDSLSVFSWREVDLMGTSVMVQRNEGLGAEGYTLLAASAAEESLGQVLLAAGAAPLPEESYHVLRVEAGVPAPGIELTDRVNPLEAGLRRFCDDHKGCYTGQEIIARQVTYDKITTHLVGLNLEAGAEPGATLYAGSHQVGFVTSTVHSPALDRAIALAFVRRPHHEPSTILRVVHQQDETTAQVNPVPWQLPGQ